MIYLKQVNIHSDNFPVREGYPFGMKILHHTDFIEFNSGITFFIGENGTGKSTLLKALAIKSGIHIWQNEFNLRVKKNPHEDLLYEHITLQWEKGPVPGSYFGSQIFSHFAKNLEEWALNDPGMLQYFGGKSLIAQSHGQSLLSYFFSRYKLKGLYFLDEPETALSPSSLIDLLNLLIRINKMGHAQFIIATHSPFLMACPDSQIYTFGENNIYQMDYKECRHYKLYKDFMDNPDEFISK